MAEKTAQDEAPLARLAVRGVTTTSERVRKDAVDGIRAAFDEAESKISLLLAAGCVADPAFPSEASIPRVASVPYNHLGHQPLLNYDLLCECVWGTARRLREEKRKHTSIGARIVAALAFAIGIFGGYRTDHIVLGGVLGVVLAAVVFAVLVEDFSKRAAALKAEAIQCLLEGHVPCGASMPADFLPTDTARIQSGSGFVGTSDVPVFFAPDTQEPFPGLGRIQTRELFLCPPRDLGETILFDEERLHARVLTELESAADTSGFPNVLLGEAIVVDSATVPKDSAWLDAEGRPFLYVSKAEPVDVASIDRRASVRLYAGLQVLLPEYLTCISVFVRPFLAGTSAAFEMVVSTLGPPLETAERLQEVVHYHRLTVERETRSRASASVRQQQPRSIRSQIQSLKMRTESRSDPLAASKLARIASLAPAGAWHREESREADSLQDQRLDWVGRHVRPVNWREVHSLALTEEFFGGTECKAAIRALYHQVARVVLSSFDALGFDIDQYRDSSGRWAINADHIEQMVAGERLDASTKTPKDGKAVAAA
jgi:hypothetical protein